MKRIVKKHPLAIRWFHWINFPLLMIMIWSGLLIYWANDVYAIKIAGKALIKFFPQSFYEALNLKYRLGEGMAFHFVFMWFFIINGVLYVLYTIFSGEWRYLLLNTANKKYNSAQRFAYTLIILFGIGSFITGIAIYKPIQFGWLCWLCGGYEWARAEHFILTIGYCLFILIHIVQVMRAGWSNFRAMVTGFEVKKIDINNEKAAQEPGHHE
jgi:thiosulfate reductase cytochrome b subunit